MPTTRSSGVRLVPEPTLMHYKTLEMWLATTDRKDQPEHWILLLRPPNANKCTWYHIDGGYPPSSYRHSIEENRWFNHREMPKQQFICTIRGRDQLEVHRAAQAVPPQHCQQYVVGVLSELETSARELVPRGTAERLSMLVTPNLFEGPTRVVPENEWVGWVKKKGCNVAGVMLMRTQRWVDNQGNRIRRLSYFERLVWIGSRLDGTGAQESP